MRIAICEDNKDHADILQGMIEHWAKREQQQVEIGYYQSAEHFLFSLKDGVSYELIFIDIQMEKMNGMELARLIRREDKMTILIFTTGLAKLAPKGYEVLALRYLVKPLKEREVSEALTRTVQLLEQNKRDAVVISSNGELRRVFKNEIYYIEADDHYINLYTRREIIRFKEKLKLFESQFEEPRFCKCHRSYIVNLHYTTKITREGVELENGAVLPVSRNRWDVLNKCYLAYYTQ